MTVEKVVDVLYGSETGNAEAIAERIYGDLEAHHFKAGKFLAVKDFKDTGIAEDGGKGLNEKLFVFVCSTTGDGDPPYNAAALMKFMRKKTLPKDLLGDMHFTVLGKQLTNSASCYQSERIRAPQRQLDGEKHAYSFKPAV